MSGLVGAIEAELMDSPFAGHLVSVDRIRSWLQLPYDAADATRTHRSAGLCLYSP